MVRRPAATSPRVSARRRGARPAASRDELGAVVLDALPISLYVVDRELRVVAWNASRERGPLGRPRSEVLGRPLRQVLRPQGFKRTAPLLRRVLATGAPLEETTETPSGRVYHVRRFPVKGARGVSHVVSWFEDLTDRRALELRLIASDRLAFLGQLVAGVAHEVANPLAGIAGCAEMLAALAAQNPDPKGRREAHEFGELIRGEVARCERILRSLLDAARPDPSSVCDVSEMVSTTLRLIERHPAFARVKVEARLPPHLPPARIDGDSLRQVVTALALNAAQAMPGGGTLTLRCARQAGGLALDVLDRGPGVPPHLRAAIFEPFFQGEQAKGGSGLGLAIARSLVRGRGGDLQVRARRGGGAAFRVRLALAGRRA